MEYVILVDENDRELGTMEKMRAHEAGLLHRAFSVFIFDPEGRLLIHRRADEKYHCGGLWTNTCCSHPRPGEDVKLAAERRLREEMGINCTLQPAFTFVYKAVFDNGLTEHEFDHVLVGFSGEQPKPDPAEVSAWKWVSPAEALSETGANPAGFTPWFRLSLAKVLNWTSRL
ncbi:MAG: isopentenyl-diphosphate delta-isomerase [Bacteroidetes bacterium]|nr:MAG: isopentenyl-diphosphate delta-isomerase [Bacteroidota bacterium]